MRMALTSMKLRPGDASAIAQLDRCSARNPISQSLPIGVDSGLKPTRRKGSQDSIAGVAQW